MAEPRIDRIVNGNGNQINKPWRLLWIVGVIPLLVIIAFILYFFIDSTALGKAGKDDIYDPAKNGAGFVIKANELLGELLHEVNDTVDVVSLESLNKRYSALEFALPYKEEGSAYIEASALRLVKIHPEYIKDEKLRLFFFNSRLPLLLQRQQEQLDETFFKIRSRSLQANKHGRKAIEISSITVIPSMFKVALSKNPWKGTIECSPNCLFDDSTTIFLSYGNTILPMNNEAVRSISNNDIQFDAIMDRGILLTTEHAPIDYYKYYQKAFLSSTAHSIRINMLDNVTEQPLANISFCYSDDSLCVSRNCGLLIVGKGKAKAQMFGDTDKPTTIRIEDGMKILVYNEAFNQKYGEFTIYKKNPLTTLSTLITSSMGTTRYFVSEYQTDLFTQQLLRGIYRNLSDRKDITNVSLSIDPLLSREFENEIRNYLHAIRKKINEDKDKPKPKSQIKEQYDISMTVMDLATGEVLACPFYTTQFENDGFSDLLRMTTKNPALIRRSIGSTFKPMIALAAVQASPSLIHLNTSNHSLYGSPNWDTERVNFIGRKTKTWASGSKNHWNGCDFETFIGRSDDVFPVALATLAMSGRKANVNTKILPLGDSNDYFELGADSLLRFKKTNVADPLNYPFTSWISFLYHVVLRDENNVTASDIYLFDELNKGLDLDEETKSSGLQEISPDLTQLRIDRFLDGDEFRVRLVPWILGQGDNMWNCVKLAEAWCRMIGKRKVKATFIKPSNKEYGSLVSQAAEDRKPTNVGARSKDAINSTWNEFLNLFNKAQEYRGEGATLYPMYDRVKQLNSKEGTKLRLLSKTGTPDAYARYEYPMLGSRNRFMDLGMYTFALVDTTQYNRILADEKGGGIVCVMRITRSYECRNCTQDKQCKECEGYWGVKSTHARDFFAENDSNRLQKLYDMTRNYYYSNRKESRSK